MDSAPPPEYDPWEAFWLPVATGAPHRWIALTTDYRVADRLMRQQTIILPGWPDAPAADWLNGPYAADWWLPVLGRRMLITAWSDADAHLATLVMPVIERMRPARLLYRNYRNERPAEEVNPLSAAPAILPQDTPSSLPPGVRNETGHAAAA